MRVKDVLGLRPRPRLLRSLSLMASLRFLAGAWRAAAPAAFVVGLLTPVLVLAQQTDDFVPVDPAEHGLEQLPAAPMVMAAYALVWLILIGYVWSLRRRQARVDLEVAALRARVNERAGPDPRQP